MNHGGGGLLDPSTGTRGELCMAPLSPLPDAQSPKPDLTKELRPVSHLSFSLTENRHLSNASSLLLFIFS